MQATAYYATVTKIYRCSVGGVAKSILILRDSRGYTVNRQVKRLQNACAQVDRQHQHIFNTITRKCDLHELYVKLQILI